MKTLIFIKEINSVLQSSSTISNALYELALQPSIQDKLRNEIRESIEANEGKLTYDAIKGMKYLDKVFKGM